MRDDKDIDESLAQRSGLIGRGVMSADELSALLHTHYGVRNPSPRRLTDSWEGNTFYQAIPGGDGWIVRVVESDRAVAEC